MGGFLVFSDEQRVAEVGFELQRNRKSVVCLCWYSIGGWHDHIDRSVREHTQENSVRFRDKSSILKRGAADVRGSYQMTGHGSKFATKQEEAMRG